MSQFCSSRASARIVQLWAAPFLATLMLVLWPLGAFAAIIDVDGSSCTLPDAIIAANLDSATGGCAAGVGTDTLRLTQPTYSFITGPYSNASTSNTALPPITSTIIISGDVGGSTIERTGVTQYGLFFIDSSANLTLEQVVLFNGYATYGGAIYNQGHLTLRESQIISNSAEEGGGFYNESGTATLIDTQVISNRATYEGGGFYNGDNSRANLTNSEVVNNRALSGGGFYNYDDSTSTLTNTTIISNIVSNRGGGFYNEIGTATLTDSDVISNRALSGGGFYNDDTSTATLTNSDVISNSATNKGGGIFNSDSTATLTNSDVISNSATNNGGGVYNSQSTATLTDSDVISNSAQSGGGIYNDESTATLTDSDVISNTATQQGGGIYNDVSSTATLVNSGVIANRASSHGGGIFNYTNSTVTLTNTHIISNTSSTNGGGIYNGIYSTGSTAMIMLTDSDVISNAADFGGGIFNDEGTTTLTNTHVISNTAGSHGGGIWNAGSAATVTLIASDVIANRASYNGGGINNFTNSTLTLTDSAVISNTAQSGGGIYSYFYSTVTLTDSSLISNTAEVGGGIYNEASTAIFSNTHVLANVAIEGGGLYNVDGATADFTNSQISANRVTSDGGGIYNSATFTATGIHLQDNDALGTGSALYQDDGQSSIEQSCIVNNTDTAVTYFAGTVIDAPNNWWGSPDGPSGAGPGVGDSVSSSVTFTPFLTGCPQRTLEVAFSKHVSPQGNLMPGQPVTYTLVVTNTGISVAKDIYINDLLPSAFQMSSVVTTGQPITLNGSSLVMAELPPTQVATIAFVGQVDPMLNSELILTNTAVLTQLLVGGVIIATVSNPVILPVAEWSAAGYVSDEDSGAFTATVVLSPTTPYVTVTVQVLITDSVDALAVAAVQGLTFPPNSGSQPVVVTFTNDGEISSRTLRLALQSPVGALLGADINIPLTLVESDAAPGIVVAKSANTTQATVGGTITYTYRITNTGNVTLTTVSAVDDRLGAVAGLAGELAPSATRSTTLAYVVLNSDLPGPLVNTVVVNGTDIFSTLVTDSDGASVALNAQPPAPVPGIAVSKRVNTAVATVGDTITYTYRITNTGNVTLTTVSAVDDRLGAVAGLAGELAPAATRSASLTYVVLSGDLPGPLVNTVVVTGTDIFNIDVSDTATASVALLGATSQIYLPRLNR